MLALIAGTGDLPRALVARLDQVVVCALDGFAPAVPVDMQFRLEHLGTFLVDLQRRGVTRICMAGAVQRPSIDPAAIDAATVPLIPHLQAAMAQGDDGALRAVISIFEEAGFAVVAAHEIAPELLPEAGVLTRVRPDDVHQADAHIGAECVVQMGAADVGQACIVAAGTVVAREGVEGTEAMLSAYSGTGILYKAPKPAQDWRADLPVIGPATATQAAEVGLAGIAIAAGGVMVLDLPGVVATLDAQDMFLWVRA